MRPTLLTTAGLVLILLALLAYYLLQALACSMTPDGCRNFTPLDMRWDDSDANILFCLVLALGIGLMLAGGIWHRIALRRQRRQRL